jgi:hypothetical protein
MIPKFIEAEISELQGLWPQGEHFPTITWDKGAYRLMGKKHCFRSGKCPLKLYDIEIQERYNSVMRDYEGDFFLPTTQWDSLLKWYKNDWHRISVCMESLADAERDFYYKSLVKRTNEGSC